MPGQESLVVPEMERSKLPVISPRNVFAAHNVNVTAEAPIKKEAISQSDCLQSENEDAVDWDFWLTPEVLSGEGPPPFG
ncbi:hypothetical protein N7466_001633 [Penicillium verhagenii]|uniref:uncharacterized protein n=1 Tax=Penicillium verhagenii TaxID=1562060 RepID=UPI0025452FB8|nr:uncharacterized protein N7466_001633 [Penicillium verhagenii]KAJ5938499.1 hypothetical protein N7466_001633 [Penicillium verhagenii]